MCVIKYATRSSRSSKKSILRFWIPWPKIAKPWKKQKKSFNTAFIGFRKKFWIARKTNYWFIFPKRWPHPPLILFYMKPWNLSVLTKSRSVTFWIRIQLSPANNSSPAIIPWKEAEYSGGFTTTANAAGQSFQFQQQVFIRSEN